MSDVHDLIDPVDRHVGARIREERVNAGVTQAQLGAAIGVTFQQVQKYERGANRISASMIVRVATTLGVPLMSLFPTDAVQRDRSDPLGSVKGGRRLLDAYVAMSPEQRDALLLIASQLAAQSGPVRTKSRGSGQGVRTTAGRARRGAEPAA